MDDFADLLDALPVEEYYGSQIPPARSDAQVGVLSLPAELLQSIAEYCSSRTILALMRVNSLLYGIALRCFYAKVHIACNKFSDALEALDPGLTTIEQILPNLYHKKFGVLGGLVRRPEHLANLRLLHLIDYPIPLAPGHLTYHKIIRHVLENAPSIQSIILPWSNIARTAGFDGLVISSSLQSVVTPMVSSSIVSSILRTAWLQSLDVTFQCATFELLHELLDHMDHTLRHLRCLVHVHAMEWDASTKKIDSFISKFTRLETLTVGYCTCVLAAEPQPEALIQCYAQFVKELPYLKSVTIVDRRHHPRQGNVKETVKGECKIVDALSQANTTLQNIGIEYLYAAKWDLENAKLVMWSAPMSRINLSDDVKGESCIWTPSPRLQSRWGYWFDKFDEPTAIREAMSQRWSYAPSLWELTWYNTYQRAA